MIDLVGWLVRVRRLFLVAQGVLLTVAFATGERPIAGLVLLGIFATVELVRSWAGWSPSAAVHLTVDVLGLSALIGAWGEPHQPLQVFYLVDVALLATFVPVARAWNATGLAIVGQTLALVVPALLGTMATPEPPLHLAAHAATFALGAVAITLFLGGVADANRSQAAALREAEEGRERAARLAAIGTLAAGVAHELATPLGSVELLAEEIATDPEALPELRRQLVRCRAILDRMLARGTASDGRTDRIDLRVGEWVDEWRRASPTVPITLSAAGCDRPVLGAPDGWRAALWTVLDNARTAGPPIRVSVVTVDGGIEVAVDDDGPGIDPDLAARAGEPFLTRWPGGTGAGLGLYVARTFARGAGGDLRLERRPERGTRAILSLVGEEP